MTNVPVPCPPNGEESGTGRPSCAAGRRGGRADDDFALPAAGLLATALGPAPAHPHLSAEGK
ncbi:hypothetical protein [Streptomyces sp. CC208A]|uniref:hypothetical protein n=1 Tax=Streptomyces sp. CC208A TaxID=3044573 RepID=UPI0024A92CF9|nr:hypothetical protein [Streptomyces sp. CC208A]